MGQLTEDWPMTEYRSAAYPDHVLEEFGVWREPGREGRFGGYAGQATS